MEPRESFGHLAPSPTNRAIVINMNVYRNGSHSELIFIAPLGAVSEMAPGVCCINYGRMALYLEPKREKQCSK